MSVCADMQAMDNELVKNTCFQSSSRQVSTTIFYLYEAVCAFVCTAVSCVLCRWTPKGQLVAHIHEHKDSINRYIHTYNYSPFSVCYFLFSIETHIIRS